MAKKPTKGKSSWDEVPTASGAENLHRFQTLEEARAMIVEFIDRYNRERLIERLDFRTPAQARAEGWRAAA